MKHFATERAKIEKAYRQAKAEIMEEREPCCAGCGAYSGQRTFSHRIARSRRRDIIADKRNIDIMCPTCADHVEAGRYDKLNNGREIERYIMEVDEEYYFIKTILKAG